jgi:hypothetical protein
VRLIEGDYLSVDQSALTGESLPVDKKIGDVAYSSSVAKQGEMVAVATATGANTYLPGIPGGNLHPTRHQLHLCLGAPRPVPSAPKRITAKTRTG